MLYTISVIRSDLKPFLESQNDGVYKKLLEEIPEGKQRSQKQHRDDEQVDVQNISGQGRDCVVIDTEK